MYLCIYLQEWAFSSLTLKPFRMTNRKLICNWQPLKLRNAFKGIFLSFWLTLFRINKNSIFIISKNFFRESNKRKLKKEWKITDNSENIIIFNKYR